MTRDEIFKMDPGRELDELVAAKVLGLEDWYFINQGTEWETDFNYFHMRGERHYSTDLSLAWEVVVRFEEMEISKMGSDYVASMGDPGYYYQSKSAPEAICKAALLAVLDL